ncbi:hypothetical protein MNEG_11719, partial [Monoraphidium neglectum]
LAQPGIPEPAPSGQLAVQPAGARGAADGVDGGPGRPQGRVAVGAVQPAVLPDGRDADHRAPQRLAPGQDGAADRGHQEDARAGGRAQPRRRLCARPHAGGGAVGRQGRLPGGLQAQGAVLLDAGAAGARGDGRQGGRARRVPVPRVQHGGALQGGGVHGAAQEQARVDQVDPGGGVHVPGRRV